MLTRQDFDQKNAIIRYVNWSKRQRKKYLVWASIILALFALFTLASFPLLSVLALAGIACCILAFRKVTLLPMYTEEQWMQDRASQEVKMQQIRRLAQQEAYGDSPIRENRYIPDALRQSVLVRDKYQCCQCGSASYLELDHIIPRSKGGATSYENLQILCRGCNARKGSR